MKLSKNPEDWKLNCTECGVEKIYKRFDSYQKAHKKIFQENEPCRCFDCAKKVQRQTFKTIDYPKDPKDWFVNCCKCNEKILFTNRSSFTHTYKKVHVNNKPHMCTKCQAESAKGNTRNEQIYSRNPEDWVINCDSCTNPIVYTTRLSWQAALNKNKRRGKTLCHICCQRELVRSEESINIWREKFIRTMQNRSDEVKQEYSRKLSESQTKRWNDMSDEDREEISNKLIEMHKNRDEETKKEIYSRISQSRKKYYKLLRQIKNYIPVTIKIQYHI